MAGEKSSHRPTEGEKPKKGFKFDYDVTDVPSVTSVRWPSYLANGERPKHDEDITYQLYSADELGGFSPVEFLVDGWIAKNEFTGLYGEGNTFKSLIMQSISCQLGADGHVVVYIAAEGVSGVRARIDAWKSYHGVDQLPRLLILPRNVNIHRPPDHNRLIQDIEQQLEKRELISPSLVVVDTLARNFVGGSEIDPKDMGLFVDGCEKIRRHFETALVVIHHTTKDGKNERGTESLRNATFAMFRTERDSDRGNVVELKCDRMKDAEEPRPVTLSFMQIPLPWIEREDGGLVTSLVATEFFPPELAAVKRLKLERFRKAVLIVLPEEGSMAAAGIVTAARDLGEEDRVAIRQGDAVNELKAWSEEPNAAIEKAAAGGYQRVKN
jgi:hypothetical protein